MFAKTIIDSDAFLDMPISARLLYYDLGMRADDDGFVNSPKKIMKMIGASQDDLFILCQRKFILPFDSGIIVIKHWRINNYLRNDRYKETIYVEEKSMLTVDEKGKYHMNDDGIPTGIPSTVSTGKDRLGKVSSGKDRLGEDSDCSEPQGDSEPEAETAVLILNDGSGWRPTAKDYEEWCRVYPNVDVFHELERMRQWCLSNPTKRKTRKGIRRFVTTWLDGEQNKPRKTTVSKLDQIDQWAERKKNEESNLF